MKGFWFSLLCTLHVACIKSMGYLPPCFSCSWSKRLFERKLNWRRRRLILHPSDMSRQQMGFCALCQCLNQSVTPARSTSPAPDLSQHLILQLVYLVQTFRWGPIIPEIYMFLSSPGFVTHRSRWPRAPGQGRGGSAWVCSGGVSHGLLCGDKWAQLVNGAGRDMWLGDMCATAEPL